MTKVAREPAPWGEAHRREALRRIFEIGAQSVAGAPGSTWRETKIVTDHGPYETEGGWRAWLLAAGCCAARIDREVRRARALAEGRLVRETSERFEVNFHDGSQRESFVTIEGARRRAADWPNARPVRVRVTRIRRAP